jgi:hypothetical protein
LGKHDWKFQSHHKWISKGPTYSLGPYDLKVYMVLLGHRNDPTGRCFPSIPTIADEADLDVKTVKASRNRLRELGLITWIVDKTVKNSAMYDFPLEFGSESEQASISAKLRSAHLAALRKRQAMRLRGKAKRRTVGRGNKRTVGKPTKRTTNYKKELPHKNEKPDAPQGGIRDPFEECRETKPVLSESAKETSKVCKELSSTWPKDQFDPMRFYGDNFDNHGLEATLHALKGLLARGRRIENPWGYASELLGNVEKARHSAEEDTG